MAKPTGVPKTTLIFIGFGVAGIVLIGALGFLLGQSSMPDQQRVIESKLVMVRQRVAQCTQERDRLRAKSRKEPNWETTPVGRLQRENDELAAENDELMEENEELREEKAVFEETILSLKTEVEQKSHLSYEQQQHLNEMTDGGNVSWELAEILEDWKDVGHLGKDELISRLVDELKLRKTLFQSCQSQLERGRALHVEEKARSEKKKREDATKKAVEAAVAAALAEKKSEAKASPPPVPVPVPVTEEKAEKDDKSKAIQAAVAAALAQKTKSTAKAEAADATKKAVEAAVAAALAQQKADA